MYCKNEYFCTQSVFTFFSAKKAKITACSSILTTEYYIVVTLAITNTKCELRAVMRSIKQTFCCHQSALYNSCFPIFDCRSQSLSPYVVVSSF